MILYDEVNVATKNEERIKFNQNDMKRHMSDMHQAADNNRNELSQIYSIIRDIILEREQ